MSQSSADRASTGEAGFTLIEVLCAASIAAFSIAALYSGLGTNLHATWDSEIIEYKATSLSDVLNSKKYTSEEMTAVQKIDIIGWAKQSRGYLKEAYSVRNNKADDQYVDSVYPVIKTQLLDAGIRLASVLEHYFKTTT